MISTDGAARANLPLHFKIWDSCEIDQNLTVGEEVLPAVIEELMIAGLLVRRSDVKAKWACLFPDAERPEYQVTAPIIVLVRASAADGSFQPLWLQRWFIVLIPQIQTTYYLVRVQSYPMEFSCQCLDSKG